MLDILRMAKNEELAVKMIFSSEQPLTGMNEGTLFPRRMCRKIEGIPCREEGIKEKRGPPAGDPLYCVI